MKLAAISIILFLVSSFSEKEPCREDPAADFPAIAIGDQIWMTINWDARTPKSWYFDNDSAKNMKYGRLYFFSNAKAAAPPGWHLPSLDEWITLINHLGGTDQAASQLTEEGSSGLNLSFSGNKSANISPTDIFNFLGDTGFYWTATEDGEQTAYAIRIDRGKASVDIHTYRKANGFSVRYIKDK